MQHDTYLLVPGAWHGSWCWRNIVPRLEQAGHTVLTVDLPGCGADNTPPANVTLELWTRHVCRMLEAQTNPLILVGHSRGGIVISQVAERLPHKIKRLVYVSGFLLPNGNSVLRMLRNDENSTLLQHVTLAPDKTRWLLAESMIEELFYGECASEDIALARAQLGIEPVAPLMAPLQITNENFGSVPLDYIECLYDKAVPPALQKRMYTALGCKRVLSLDTDHSP